MIPRKTTLQGSKLTRTESLVRKPIQLSKKPPKRVQKHIKPKGVSKLLKDADAIFSRYVRLKDADQEGHVSCYTCGHRNHYKKLQNGHYISRFYKKYRFDERNTRVQCSMCNMWKSGDIPTFRMKLVQEIGLEEIENMENDYKELYRLTPEFLYGIIELYTAKVAQLGATLGSALKNPQS